MYTIHIKIVRFIMCVNAAAYKRMRSHFKCDTSTYKNRSLRIFKLKHFKMSPGEYILAVWEYTYDPQNHKMFKITSAIIFLLKI